jgi:hypothetical protein
LRRLPSARKISVDGNAILLTPQGGGSATRLGTLDTLVGKDWVFYESRRVFWVGLGYGGPFRIALIG